MNTETIGVWRATPLAQWWETPSRRIALLVYIGCLIMTLFFGAFAPNDNTFFMSATGVGIGVLFVITYLLLDMVADLIRSQKLILNRLESLETPHK